MRRTSSYNAELSKRLQNKKYAAGFLLCLIEGEDALSLEEALKTLIESMGIKEFAKMTHSAPSNVVAFLKGRRHPRQSTLDAYLKPFGLKTELIAIAA